MKVIKYKIGTEGHLSAVVLDYGDANLAIAKQEAHGGKYTIEDDGAPAPAPTTDERLAALEVAMLEMLGVTVDD